MTFHVSVLLVLRRELRLTNIPRPLGLNDKQKASPLRTFGAGVKCLVSPFQQVLLRTQVMANFSCIGCKRRFQNQRALSAHTGKRRCDIKTRAEGARLLNLRISSQKEADKNGHQSDRSESIHDDREDGPSGCQPTAEEEMRVDQVGLS